MFFKRKKKKIEIDWTYDSKTLRRFNDVYEELQADAYSTDNGAFFPDWVKIEKREYVIRLRNHIETEERLNKLFHDSNKFLKERGIEIWTS